MSTLTFEEKGHKYFLDNKPLTGVTSVLSVIAKPALIQWAANEAVKYIQEQVISCPPGELFDRLAHIVEEARYAHRRKKEDAGSKGTDVHAEVEMAIKECIENRNGLVPGSVSHSEQAKKFYHWADENKVKFLASEKRVYSETYWLGGTLDFLCEINGKKFVGDIKTSSGIYGREYFAQCAAYRLMLEEMELIEKMANDKGEGFTLTEFEGSVVVRLGKDGSFEEKYSYDYETDKKLFLACLDVYRAMGTFEVK